MKEKIYYFHPHHLTSPLYSLKLKLGQLYTHRKIGRHTVVGHFGHSYTQAKTIELFQREKGRGPNREGKSTSRDVSGPVILTPEARHEEIWNIRGTKGGRKNKKQQKKMMEHQMLLLLLTIRGWRQIGFNGLGSHE